jgi:hypothetical protein
MFGMNLIRSHGAIGVSNALSATDTFRAVTDRSPQALEEFLLPNHRSLDKLTLSGQSKSIR